MRTLKIIFGSFACGGLALVLHVFSAVHLRCRHGQQPSYSQLYGLWSPPRTCGWAFHRLATPFGRDCPSFS